MAETFSIPIRILQARFNENRAGDLNRSKNIQDPNSGPRFFIARIGGRLFCVSSAKENQIAVSKCLLDKSIDKTPRLIPNTGVVAFRKLCKRMANSGSKVSRRGRPNKRPP